MKKSEKTAALTYEEKLYSQGFKLIAGIDEAGRGPLAGPVTACAVIMPKGLIISGVYDSKKVSEKRRLVLAEQIKEAAVDYALGWADAGLVDEINILQAAYYAMEQAVNKLKKPPDVLLVDGVQNKWKPGIYSEFIIGGDRESHSIAAASILAKVSRDKFMTDWHEKYPQYGFDKHKGYGTLKHREAILKYGLCPIHRKSFLKSITPHKK